MEANTLWAYIDAHRRFNNSDGVQWSVEVGGQWMHVPWVNRWSASYHFTPPRPLSISRTLSYAVAYFEKLIMT